MNATAAVVMIGMNTVQGTTNGIRADGTTIITEIIIKPGSEPVRMLDTNFSRAPVADNVGRLGWFPGNHAIRDGITR